jgi:hypothetical protein
MINYDSKFNGNEIFDLILFAFYILVFILPKQFPKSISLMFIIFGSAVGRMADQLIGTPALDFYDINDSSSIEIFDIILYLSYGPFSYFIVYIFDKLKIKKQNLIFYIVLWALVAIGFEHLGSRLGVFHYKNGYKILYSFPIYLITYSILFILYYKIFKRDEAMHIK